MRPCCNSESGQVSYFLLCDILPPLLVSQIEPGFMLVRKRKYDPEGSGQICTRLDSVFPGVRSIVFRYHGAIVQ